MVKKAKWLKNVKKAFIPEKMKHESVDCEESVISYPVLVATSRSFTAHFEVRVDEVNYEQKKNPCPPSPDSVTATEEDVHVDSSPDDTEFVNQSTPDRFAGKSKEEAASILIQATFRGYSARRELREMGRLARLKLLMEGSVVQRQAANTLRCMQTLTRVQSQIRSRRIRMSEENQARHKQLLQKHAKELGGLKNGNWNYSNQSKEQVEAGLLNKHEATMRRERALAYAFTHKPNLKNNSKSANIMFMDPNNPTWGWSWLERWTSDRPWEISEKEQNNNNEASSVKNSTNRETTKSSNKQKLNTSTKPKASSTSTSSSTSSSATKNPKKNRPIPPAIKSKTTDDAKSSEKTRKQSIVRSAVSDDESLARSTARRIVPTKPARAKLKAQSSVTMALNTTKATEENSILPPIKKRVPCSASPAPKPRRLSAPAKVENGVLKTVKAP